ncbi:MAG TPA: DUF2130 domain-containing protein [Steroidobacteraceae bacterium]
MSSEQETIRQLFLSLDTPVTCPKCTSRFSLQAGFARQALEQLEHCAQGALESVRAAERVETSRQAQQLAAQRDKGLRSENAQLQQLLKEQADAHGRALKEVRTLAEQSMTPQLELLRGQLRESQAKLDSIAQREAALNAREQEMELRVARAAETKARELFADDRAALEHQLARKSELIAELRSSELALRHAKSALEDREAAMQVEIARQLDAGRAELEMRVRAQERECAELQQADLQKRLDDMHAQLAEAQRKGQQGSQQLQGEVLELTLQSRLERAFPLDEIDEVKKGARGGDVIQRVTTRSGQLAGILLWEAKRARDWSPQWVAKLKEDMRGCAADMGILVITGTALPREWQAGQLFGLYEDVWISSWTTALQLAAVLRASLLDLHKQRLVASGKGEKMEAVYDYLTSAQFGQKLKAVYGAFHRMRQELESEKSQTLQRWARREKQLQSGVAELLGVAGDIQGLAQQDLPLLDIDPGADAQETQPSASDAQLGLRIGAPLR